MLPLSKSVRRVIAVFAKQLSTTWIEFAFIAKFIVQIVPDIQVLIRCFGCSRIPFKRSIKKQVQIIKYPIGNRNNRIATIEAFCLRLNRAVNLSVCDIDFHKINIPKRLCALGIDKFSRFRVIRIVSRDVEAPQCVIGTDFFGNIRFGNVMQCFDRMQIVCRVERP